jgi:hypothetical protein
METLSQRMYILEMIDQGRISASEGLGLLQALSDQTPDELNMELPSANPEETAVDSMFAHLDEIGPLIPDQQPVAESQPHLDSNYRSQENAADMRKWKRWWTIPLWVGVAITTFGALFMFQAQQSSGFGFWFICATLLLTLGVVVIMLAFQSRTAPWLHLRIQQRPGEKPERIAFSLPLPLHQATWLMKVLGHRFTGLQNQDWEQLIQTISCSASPENPILIQVDEGKSGEKVEIYIG